MITRILEIGVAVRNLGQTAQSLRFILGARQGKALTAAEYGMTAQMLRVGNIEFELMEPLDQNGLIANYIRQRGEGLHHLAFQVDDIARTISAMKHRGFQVINPEPVVAQGVKATFLHPGSCGGVLVELIEGSPRWVDDRPLPSQLQAPDPQRGVGAEGILSVGIVVEDVAAAAAIYAMVFCGHPSTSFIPDGRQSQACVFRAGNVDLVLIRMPRNGALPGPFFAAKRPGLHHIVIKVEDLGRAGEFLNNHDIDFTSGLISAADQRRCIALNPAEVSGIPILLRDNISNSDGPNQIQEKKGR